MADSTPDLTARRCEEMEDGNVDVTLKIEELDEDAMEEIKESPMSAGPRPPPIGAPVNTAGTRNRGRLGNSPLPSSDSHSMIAKSRSKMGCITCRRRRKKCDETKPSCLNCLKIPVVCEGYPLNELWRSGKQKHAEGRGSECYMGADFQKPEVTTANSSNQGYSAEGGMFRYDQTGNLRNFRLATMEKEKEFQDGLDRLYRYPNIADADATAAAKAKVEAEAAIKVKCDSKCFSTFGFCLSHDLLSKTKADAGTAAAIIENAERKKPLKFKDAIGRRFSFPFHLCNTWHGIEGLIQQAFVHVETIGPHVADGHYDLVRPSGKVIPPQKWEIMIQPDWTITMHMWPMLERSKAVDPPSATTAPAVIARRPFP